MVRSRQSGKNLYYAISMDDPAVRTFKIFQNTMQARNIIDPYHHAIHRAILYGSCSKGDDTVDSDIDLFLFVSDKEELSTMPDLVEGRKIQKRIFTGSELMILRKNEPAFIQEVEKGIELWRSDDTL